MSLGFLPVFKQKYGALIKGGNDILDYKTLKNNDLRKIKIQFYLIYETGDKNYQLLINIKNGDALFTFLIRKKVPIVPVKKNKFSVNNENSFDLTEIEYDELESDKSRKRKKK